MGTQSRSAFPLRLGAFLLCSFLAVLQVVRLGGYWGHGRVRVVDDKVQKNPRNSHYTEIRE